jgi:hypothetical protein
VKAPGTENNTTVLPANNASLVISFGPSAVFVLKAPVGILSPALIVMFNPSK